MVELVQEWFADRHSCNKSSKPRIDADSDSDANYKHRRDDSKFDRTSQGADQMSRQRKLKFVVFGAMATSLLAIIVLL